MAPPQDNHPCGPAPWECAMRAGEVDARLQAIDDQQVAIWNKVNATNESINELKVVLEKSSGEVRLMVLERLGPVKEQQAGDKVRWMWATGIAAFAATLLSMLFGWILRKL